MYASNLKARDIRNAVVKTDPLPPAPAIAVNEITPEAIMESTASINTENYSGELFDNDLYIANTSIHKNPLRGLFRKVSRVFDKTTSIEPSENNNKGKGIKIASFEIGLK